MSEGFYVVVGSTIVAVFSLVSRHYERKAEDRRRQEDRAALREERFATELARSRDEGSVVVARVRKFLTDIYPETVAFNFDISAFDRKLSRFGKDMEELRDPLEILAVRLPTPEGRALADKLRAAVPTAHNRVNELMVVMSRNKDFDDLLPEVQEEWSKANSLANQLRDALHDAPPVS